MTADFPPQLRIEAQAIHCQGDWSLAHNLDPLLRQIDSLTLSGKTIALQAEQIHKLDSVGAWILAQLLQKLTQQKNTVQLAGLQQEQQALMNLVQTETKKITFPIPTPQKLHWIEHIGRSVFAKKQQFSEGMIFLGEFTVTLWQTLRQFWLFQWQSFFNVIDEAGFQALGIVGLLCCLIGVVVAYQFGQQLKVYGANIYIVSLLGVGILQEFGPLITAVIVAGRTSSAFTAQIGTMQINEEIDALRTMGLSPIQRLVVPKVFAMLIAMPLLFVWADIFGLIGGMVVAKHMLGINFYNFLLRFPQVVALSTFMNGLVKAPVFAVIISSVGCFQGFKVGYTADSVGRQTTKSVVQAIFLIIIADAIFSIILPWQSIS